VDLGLAEASALVTGCSKGYGLATAECIATEGASVAIMPRGEQRSTLRWAGCDAGFAALADR
jgi:NAD(P)-dependent dehydrogenase (short-subunit alcohol dehydrogenase family)